MSRRAGWPLWSPSPMLCGKCQWTRVTDQGKGTNRRIRVREKKVRQQLTGWRKSVICLLPFLWDKFSKMNVINIVTIQYFSCQILWLHVICEYIGWFCTLKTPVRWDMISTYKADIFGWKGIGEFVAACLYFVWSFSILSVYMVYSSLYWLWGI